MKPKKVCQALVWFLLLASCGLFHWSLLFLIPTAQHFSRNLREAFNNVLGFERLEAEADEVVQAATEALSACGAAISPSTPCVDRFLVGILDRNESAVQQMLRRIQTSFNNTLATILDVCVDDLFATASSSFEALGAELSAIRSSADAAEIGGASCSTVAPDYCRIQHSALDVLASVPEVTAGIAQITEGDVVRIYAAYEPDMGGLHGIPYVLVLPFMTMCWVLQEVIKGSICWKRCILGLVGLQTAFYLPIILSAALACAIVAEAMFGFGFLPVTAFGQEVTLGYLCSHTSSAFPKFWNHLFGDVHHGDEMFAASAACFQVFTIVVALRALHASLSILLPRWCRRRITADRLVKEIRCKGAWPEAPYEELREMVKLRNCQLEALGHIRRRCRSLHNNALPVLGQRAKRLGFSQSELTSALAFIRESAPIIIHVDLEKYGLQLASDTHYRNQFETGTSGGTLCLKKRAMWEDELFSGAYAGAAAGDRCKYGVLNVVNDPQGVRQCRQYGCSYLLLRGVRLRTTLTPSDSAGLPRDKLATVDYYAHVFNEFQDSELARALSVATCRAFGTDSQVLRTYKEAQIHGEIRLSDHVELVMAHPSLRSQGHMTHALKTLAEKCQAQVVWIEGGIDVPSRPPAAHPPDPAAPSAPPTAGGAATAASTGASVLGATATHSDSFDAAAASKTSSFSSKRSGSHSARRDYKHDLDAAIRLSLAERPKGHLDPTAAPATSSAAMDYLEVQTDSGWVSLDPAVLASIGSSRAAWQGKVCFEARGYPYELDFDLGVQRNLVTGHCRYIRRVTAADGRAPPPLSDLSSASGSSVPVVVSASVSPARIGSSTDDGRSGSAAPGPDAKARMSMEKEDVESEGSSPAAKMHGTRRTPSHSLGLTPMPTELYTI